MRRTPAALAGIMASICCRRSGSMAPPDGSRTLKPLSAGGLWLAVILTAPSAAKCTTWKEMAGVGVGPWQKCTGMPLPAITSAAARAKAWPEKRLSWPMTTPRASSAGLKLSIR
jgi:hypothetical protein